MGSWIDRLSALASQRSDAERNKRLYEEHQRNNTITKELRYLLVEAFHQFEYRPRISIILPVYEVDPCWLALAIESVSDQIYPDWELCLADDGSRRPDLTAYLDELQNSVALSDSPVKIARHDQNRHICVASNTAASMATGEFLVLLDHDDQLAPHALWEIVHRLQSKPDADLIYSDEDKIDKRGIRYDPFFKPDWSPELLLSFNYINHLTCIRRSLFEDVGRFRPGFEFAQDYDLLLRATSQTNRIEHLAKVLYHWRAIDTSIASSGSAKSQMRPAVQGVLDDHLHRNKIQATSYAPPIADRLDLPIYQLDWPDDGPEVAIVIPTRNQHQQLRTCVDSILQHTTYRNFRVVLIDQGTSATEQLAYLRTLKGRGVEIVSVTSDNGSISESQLLNRAIATLDDEYVLLLSHDIEVLEPRWLSRMVGYLSLPDVAIAGARLLNSNGTLQHAGVTLGMMHGTSPQHAFYEHTASDCSYYFQAEVARNCSAVTSDCLLIRREEFASHGGLDEVLSTGFSDVNLCLQVLANGRRIVYVAGAELTQHYSSAVATDFRPADLAEFRVRHGQRKDGFYNPNLSANQSHVTDPAGQNNYSMFVSRPIRVVFLSHNLNLEGAPKAIYELAVGLQRRGAVTPIVVSPLNGPMASWYEKAGISVVVKEFSQTPLLNARLSEHDYRQWLSELQNVIRDLQPDITVVNTVLSASAVVVAAQLGIPAIWLIYESYSPRQLFRQFRSHQRADLRRAFKMAAMVAFCSRGTKELYKGLAVEAKSRVIHNGIDPASIEKYLAEVSREEARRRVGVAPETKLILSVGTVCKRKSQHLLASAARHLRTRRDDFTCHIVGLRQTQALDGYISQINSIIQSNQLEEFVRLVPETEAVYDHFRAADIFVLSSLVEGYNLSVLEAEAFSLPIVTTPCCGASEQTRDFINGRFFPFGDSKALAERLEELISDDDQRQTMGRNSRSWFECLKNYDEMVDEYEELILATAMQRWNSPRDFTIFAEAE